MKPEPLTAKRLDAAGCGMPGCNHDHSILYLHPRCHPNAGTSVRYEKKDRVLVVDCNACDAEVARIRVAP